MHVPFIKVRILDLSQFKQKIILLLIEVETHPTIFVQKRVIIHWPDGQEQDDRFNVRVASQAMHGLFI